jgi:hypothetical protein
MVLPPYPDGDRGYYCLDDMLEDVNIVDDDLEMVMAYDYEFMPPCRNKGMMEEEKDKCVQDRIEQVEREWRDMLLQRMDESHKRLLELLEKYKEES